MINKAVNSAKWKGLRMGRSGPIISQFFFADGCLLFMQVGSDNVGVLKRVLNQYEIVSGQKINYHKLSVFFF